MGIGHGGGVTYEGSGTLVGLWEKKTSGEGHPQYLRIRFDTFLTAYSQLLDRGIMSPEY